MKNKIVSIKILLILGCLVNFSFIPLEPQAQTIKRIALLIGINDYHSDFPVNKSLKSPVENVKYLSQILKENGRMDEIISMTDEMESNSPNFPTKKNIETKIKAIIEQTDPNDFFLFYFAGHGVSNQFGTSFLVAKDTQADEAKRVVLETSVSVENFVMKTLKDKGITKTVLLIEACRELIDKTPMINNSSILVKNMSLEKSLGATFFSTGLGNLSFELNDESIKKNSFIDYGVFSYYLIEGLKGQSDIDKNGLVTVSELFEFINPKIRSHSVAINLLQRTYLHHNKEQLSDFFPIVFIDKPNSMINQPKIIPSYYNNIQNYTYSNLKWNRINQTASWNLAKRICESMNMRLPSKFELKKVAESNESWITEECNAPCYHWTKRESFEFDAEIYSLDRGFDKFTKKITQNYVLCIGE